MKTQNENRQFQEKEKLYTKWIFPSTKKAEAHPNQSKLKTHLVGTKIRLRVQN